MLEIFLFLIQAVVISLSGVMMPGAVTAATLASGMRNKHAGALVAVGHGIVELPLIIVIVLAERIGAVLQVPGVQIGIGLAGGAFMILIGGMMALGARRPPEIQAAARAARVTAAGRARAGRWRLPHARGRWRGSSRRAPRSARA